MKATIKRLSFLCAKGHVISTLGCAVSWALTTDLQTGSVYVSFDVSSRDPVGPVMLYLNYTV